MALLDIVLPTLAETLAAAKRAFNAEFQDPELDAFKPNNLLYPFTTKLGHLLQLFHVTARENASQATPFGATGTNLDAWLDIYGVTIPGEATASGTVDITGKNGISVPLGTELLRLADGALFRTTEAVTFGTPETTITVDVEADEPGASFNTAVGEPLELQLIDDDLTPTAISGGIDGGADPADEAAKQALIRIRLSQSRIAGAAADYELLVLEFSGSIARVFVEPAGLGPATVVIFPINKNASGAEYWELTVPSAGEIAALQAYLEQPTVARVNDIIVVQAATLREVDIDVSITPNTAEVQAAITDSLRARFFESYDTGGYEIPNSEIAGAISAAAGEESHTLNDVDGGGAGADAVAVFGTILQLGTVTFSAE